MQKQGVSSIIRSIRIKKSDEIQKSKQIPIVLTCIIKYIYLSRQTEIWFASSLL